MSVGTVYAGNIIYEKIWKEPTKINVADEQITNEIIAKNISEEEAKKVAQNKLKQLKIDEEILVAEQYKLSGTEEIDYRFETDNWLITINGKTGEFYKLYFNNYDKSFNEYSLSKDEAIEVAKKYYTEFGYTENEYEFAEIIDLSINGSQYSARFYKKYGDLYNKRESVWIEFYAKDNQLLTYIVENKKCDDNPIEITKEQAIQIATIEDRKVENKPIVKTNAELRIEKMNGNAYARLNNTEEYYKPMTTTNVPNEEIVAYETEERIRKVWVVVLEYRDEETNIVNAVIKGQYSYFVDATTGEIIGGDVDDYLHWDNYWFEKNKVK